MLSSFNTFQLVLLYAIPLLFAITLHEVAHGWVASFLGDPTAKMLGRLSLNPIRHIDLVGTILIPAACMMLGGFIFGWAKPVPVTWNNLHNQRRDVPLVAVAGPMANLAMAFVWAIIAKIALISGGNAVRITQVLLAMGVIGLQVNLVLMVLNLIPIPPLDGSRIITSFLPSRTALHIQRFEQFGFIILLILLATGLLHTIMMPMLTLVQHIVVAVVGLR
jgi:Zn-dependent protease